MRTRQRSGIKKASANIEAVFTAPEGTREYMVTAKATVTTDPNADCDADGNRGHSVTDTEIEDVGPITAAYEDGREINVEKRFARFKGAIKTLQALTDTALDRAAEDADYDDGAEYPDDRRDDR